MPRRPRDSADAGTGRRNGKRVAGLHCGRYEFEKRAE